MKNGSAAKILEFLENAAASTGAILSLFLTDYATSYRKARGLPDFPKTGKRKSAQINFDTERKHKLHSLIYWLKKDGLIKKSKKGLWSITEKGLFRKKLMLEKQNNQLPKIDYDTQKSPDWKIVVFDIPEHARRKRDWLRASLKNMNFRMLQRSVWIGKIQLPESFIMDLSELNLLSYIEILEVTKSGSLKKLQADDV